MENKTNFLSHSLKRNLLMALGAFLLALPAAAQSREVFRNELVEQKAEYQSGDDAILQFISENLVYPEKAHEEKVQGVVRLVFRVETDGSVEGITVMQSLTPECDQAAIDAVRKLKRFTPACYQGCPMQVWTTIPIRFRMPESDDRKVFSNSFVEKKAKYPGGDAAILQSISENLVYPRKAQEEELQGVVRLRFSIETDGSVGEIIVEQSLSPECNQAAIDAVRKLQRFTPARHQGIPVPVWFALPIRFRII